MKPEDIKFIIVHTAATKPSMDIGLYEIRKWHTLPKKLNDGTVRYMRKIYQSNNDLPEDIRGKEGNGWSDIGYHYVIRRNGQTQTGRDLSTRGAHVKGYNDVSWGICLIGGLDKDGNPDCNYTKKQYIELDRLLTELYRKAPLAEITGHREFDGVTKTCPNFDVKEFYYDENYD